MTRFAVRRVAEVRLRGRAGSLRARAYWPPSPNGTPALLLFFSGEADSDALCRCLCTRGQLVVLSVSDSADLADAITATEWAADHGTELGADPRRLLVGGDGVGANLAVAVAVHARAQGWPPLTLHVLINPDLNQLTERTA